MVSKGEVVGQELECPVRTKVQAIDTVTILY